VVIVKTDHDNLKHFATKKKLSGRQARWAESLAEFDFVIEHRPGKSNPADGPSRRPDYQQAVNIVEDEMLPILQMKLRSLSAVTAPIFFSGNYSFVARHPTVLSRRQGGSLADFGECGVSSTFPEQETCPTNESALSGRGASALATEGDIRELGSSYPLRADFVEGLPESSQRRVDVVERRLSDGELRPNVDELSPNKRIIERDNSLEDRSTLLDRSVDVVPAEASIAELGSSYPLQIDFLEAGRALCARTEDVGATEGGIGELGSSYLLQSMRRDKTVLLFSRLCMMRGSCTEGCIVRPSASGGSPLPHLRSGLGLGSNRRRQFPKETSEVVPAEPPCPCRRASETGLMAIELGCICEKGTVLKPVGGVAGCKRRIPRLLHVSATETVFEPLSEPVLDALLLL
jgi:hypothetical protein